MCKVFKFLFKLIRILAVAVGALFVVYFWNLDQKLLGPMCRSTRSLTARKWISSSDGAV